MDHVARTFDASTMGNFFFNIGENRVNTPGHHVCGIGGKADHVLCRDTSRSQSRKKRPGKVVSALWNKEIEERILPTL